MDITDIKPALLELLRHDPEVQQAVRQTVGEEPPPLMPLDAQETALIEELFAEEREDAALAETLETAEWQRREIEALRQQQARMQDVMASYARLERVYGSYLELPAALRAPLGGLLNESSPLAFAVTGAGAMEALFAPICRIGQHCSPQELAVLNDCFDLLFDLFLLREPSFRRIVTRAGDRFDPALHAPTPDSQPSKCIVQVILPGYAGRGVTVRSCVRTGEPVFRWES